jgi:hypothetical protein
MISRDHQKRNWYNYLERGYISSLPDYDGGNLAESFLLQNL